MSLFSGSTEEVYSSYATLLYQGMKSVSRQSVVSSVAYNRNIATDLVANISNGILFKANQLYRYAKSGKYHWGLPDGESMTVPAYAQDNVKLVLETLLGNPIVLTSVNVASDGNGDYIYTADYFLVNKQGEVDSVAKQWVYNEGTGEHPLLTLKTVEQESPYYPIIPIRMNNVNLAESVEGVPDYEYAPDIKAACRYLSIDLTNLYQGINGQLEVTSDNPPEEMYVVLGVSVSANTPRTNEYLFRYFEQLHGEAVMKEEDYEYWIANGSSSSSPPKNVVTIKDAQYHAEMSYDYIKQSVGTEAINPIGTYSVTFVKNAGRFIKRGIKYSSSSVMIRKQISPTQYLEYYVHGPVYRTLVVSKSWVATDLESAFEDPTGAVDGQNFIIPLRKDVCKRMGSVKAHDLMYESIRLVTCDYNTYKLEWYQTGFFQIFIVVIAVIVSMAFPAAGPAVWTFAAAGAALANIAIAMILMPLITSALSTIAGEELALLISAVGIMYGVGIVGSGGNALGGVLTVGAPSVLSVVSAVSTGYTGLKTIEIQSELEEIAAENKVLDTAIENMYEEEMQSAYDTNRTVNMVTSDPYSIMGASSYVAESRIMFRKANYIVDTTDKFVAMSQLTDRPDSYIRLNVY